jgi:hypothetical protein
MHSVDRKINYFRIFQESNYGDPGGISADIDPFFTLQIDMFQEVKPAAIAKIINLVTLYNCTLKHPGMASFTETIPQAVDLWFSKAMKYTRPEDRRK